MHYVDKLQTSSFAASRPCLGHWMRLLLTERSVYANPDCLYIFILLALSTKTENILHFSSLCEQSCFTISEGKQEYYTLQLSCGVFRTTPFASTRNEDNTEDLFV